MRSGVLYAVGAEFFLPELIGRTITGMEFIPNCENSKLFRGTDWHGAAIVFDVDNGLWKVAITSKRPDGPHLSSTPDGFKLLLFGSADLQK
jgi:hypothetical protein